MDYLSPFNGNPSTYAVNPDSTIDQADYNTLFEMEVISIVRPTLDRYVAKHFNDAFCNITGNLSCVNEFKEQIPYLIGPDRTTILHTLNTLQSFDGSLPLIRPDYLEQLDIVGTQSIKDLSFSYDGFKSLQNEVKSAAKPIWCTMCDQEYYRNSNFNESSSNNWG